MKRCVSTLVLATLQFFATAQIKDSLPIRDSSIDTMKKVNLVLREVQQNRAKVKSLVFPSILIAYGFIALGSEELHEMDYSIKEEIHQDHPGIHTHIDNYLQYAPGLAVYALNAAGIKGKNNFRDRTMIYLLANVMTGTAVQSLKAVTRSPRPDGGHNAFPSGHTATAFMNAEFLRQEYKDVSPLYGVAGYAVAATTGLLRMSNNVHWFRDILPGAGFGILSTRISYWIYPAIKKKIFRHGNGGTFVMPTYQEGGWGIAFGCTRSL
jgi:membrane-associated phospholipid phosphatase